MIMLADRWVISDFAFPSFPGTGHSINASPCLRATDPVSGGWFLYALQHGSRRNNWLGDYPKMAMWNDRSLAAPIISRLTCLMAHLIAFNGVRAFALDRASMLSWRSCQRHQLY